MNPDEAIDQLTTAGLLTRKQAYAFVMADIEAQPRWATAEAMGISKNTYDNHLQKARQKVEQAYQTMHVIGDARGITEKDRRELSKS